MCVVGINERQAGWHVSNGVYEGLRQGVPLTPNPQTTSWIRNFLPNRRQAVVVDGATSKFVPVESGVNQGSVLDPCLYLLYINNLPKGLTSTIHLFADNTACHKEINNVTDQHALQKDLDQLALREEKWKMSFLFSPGQMCSPPVRQEVENNLSSMWSPS